MRISVTEAKGQLTDLVRRAEAGDVIVTRHGHAMLDAVQASSAAQSTLGQDAARSQDVLYDRDGLQG